MTDIEILRLHYAETLGLARTLHRPPRGGRAHLRPAIRAHVGIYLAASEMSFREQDMMVFQIQLTKRQGVVPMTRDYIGREERGCARRRRPSRPPLRLAGE